MDSDIERIINGAKNIPGNVLVYLVSRKEDKQDVLYASKNLNVLFNYTVKEFKKLNDESGLIKEFFKHSDFTYENAFVFTEEINHTYRIKIKGGYIWIRAISKVVMQDDDNYVVITLLNDISKETRGFEEIIERGNELIIVYDNEYKKVLYVSKKALNINKKDLSDVIDKKVYELFFESSYESFKENVLSMKENDYLYDDRNDLYFQVDTRNISWRDIDSTALVLHDITSIIKDKNKMEESYRTNLEKRMKSYPDVFMSYHVDLTDGQVISQYDETTSEALLDYNEVFRHILDITYNSSDKFSLIEKLRLKYILQENKKGTYLFDYNSVVYFNLRLRFCLLSIRIIDNPNNDHIEALFTYRDNSEKFFKEIIEKQIFEKDYLQVGLISTKQGKIFFQDSKEVDPNVMVDGELDYYETIDYLARNYVKEESRELFIKNAKIETILENLNESGKYSYVVKAINSSISYGYSKCSYHIANKELGLILFTTEDITKEIETDQITGGLNREGFNRRVDGFLEKRDFKRTEYAYIYFNILNFKAINSSYGHSKGNELLKKIFDSLLSSSMKPLIGARIEADNFALIVRRNKVDIECVKQLCSYSGMSEVGEVNLRCGIYYIDDNTQVYSSKMYDLAKLALDYARDDSDNIKIFTQEMVNEYVANIDVLSDFSSAILRGEIKVFYQPVVDANTGEIKSAEALVRWQKSDGSIIPPSFFVPIIEETGNISKLDEYVINHTIEFITKRYISGEKIVPISVNMSRKDFFDDQMIEEYYKSMKNSKLPKNMFRIEITESAYFDIQNKGRVFLNKVRKNGGNILIDDFGTGASSFATLRDYDFDILKLDMGFIKRIGNSSKDNHIIISVIDMAKKLDLKVIAEGVETKEQVDFLIENNCDYFQGYYFYKPIPEEEFEKLLK